MEHRKPPGVTWESWVDKQIREGYEQGAFDHLPGAGQPIRGLDAAHDEDWWIKEKLKREDLSYLPPTLAIRKRVEEARLAIAVATTEPAVRSIIDEINGEIWRVNALASAGPPSTVVRFDEEETVAAWRRDHPADDVAPSDAVANAPEPQHAHRRRRALRFWWAKAR